LLFQNTDIKMESDDGDSFKWYEKYPVSKNKKSRKHFQVVLNENLVSKKSKIYDRFILIDQRFQEKVFSLFHHFNDIYFV
jgi:hypothetical protein